MYMIKKWFFWGIGLSSKLIQSNPALRSPTHYGHLIITDSFLCPWGKKALTFSLNSNRSIRTLNLWNRQLTLFSCAMNRFSYKVNLTNTDTLLSTVCCSKSFFFEGQKTFNWPHVHVPSTIVHQIGWIVDDRLNDDEILDYFHINQVMQRTVFDYAIIYNGGSLSRLLSVFMDIQL